MAKDLKDLEDDEEIPDDGSDSSDDTDSADPIEFGDPKLLSQEAYDEKIHAPDDLGHAVERKPASESEDDDTDKEFRDSEAIAKDELKKKPEPKEDADGLVPSAPKSNLDKYQEFINEYKRLQQNRQNSDLVAGLAAAGGKIGQSMAGKYSGNFTPDPAGPNLIRQMGERPVQDFEQGQVVQGRGMQLQGMMNSNDPNSAQSKLVRQYLNNSIFKNSPLPDNVSATDAASVMKMVGKPQATHLSQLPMVNQQTGEKTMATFNPTLGTFTDIAGKPLGDGWVRDYRAQSFVDPATQERLGFSGGTGKVSGTLTGPGINRPGAPEAKAEGPPVELNRTMLTAQQSKQLDHARDKFLSEVKGDRSAINSADRVMEVLQSGQSLGDLPAEEQDQMSRAFGQTGHITDAQMGRTLGRADWKSRLNLAKSMFFEGKIDDENRQFLMDVMQTIKNQNQQFVTNKAKVYSSNLANDFATAPNLKKSKVTPDSIIKLLSVEAAASSSAPSQQKMLIDNRDGKLKPIQADKYDAALKAKDKDGKPLFSAPEQ